MRIYSDTCSSCSFTILIWWQRKHNQHRRQSLCYYTLYISSKKDEVSLLNLFSYVNLFSQTSFYINQYPHTFNSMLIFFAWTLLILGCTYNINGYNCWTNTVKIQTISWYNTRCRIKTRKRKPMKVFHFSKKTTFFSRIKIRIYVHH